MADAGWTTRRVLSGCAPGRTAGSRSRERRRAGTRSKYGNRGSRRPRSRTSRRTDERSSSWARPFLSRASSSARTELRSRAPSSARTARVRAATETNAEGRFSSPRSDRAGLRVRRWRGRGVREVTGVALPQGRGILLRLVLGPPPSSRAASWTRRRAGRAGRRRRRPGREVASLGARREPTVPSRCGRRPPGDFRLTAIAPRYVVAVGQIARQARRQTVEVLVRPAASVAGRVLDEQRRPVRGRRIQAWDPEFAPGYTGPHLRPYLRGRLVHAATGAGVRDGEGRASHPDFEPLTLGDLGLRPGEARSGLSSRCGAARSSPAS